MKKSSTDIQNAENGNEQHEQLEARSSLKMTMVMSEY